MAYSRPSAVNPPRPLKYGSSRNGNGAEGCSSNFLTCSGGGRGVPSGRTAELFGQRSANRAQRCLGNGENQIQVFLGNLIRFAKEHAARLIHSRVQGMRFHQAQQLLMERLFITGRLAIQNDEVGLKAAQPPIGVSNQQFADQSQAPANR